jgi:hypothetical protein
MMTKRAVDPPAVMPEVNLAGYLVDAGGVVVEQQEADAYLAIGDVQGSCQPGVQFAGQCLNPVCGAAGSVPADELPVGAGPGWTSADQRQRWRPLSQPADDPARRTMPLRQGLNALGHGSSRPRATGTAKSASSAVRPATPMPSMRPGQLAPGGCAAAGAPVSAGHAVGHGHIPPVTSSVEPVR